VAKQIAEKALAIELVNIQPVNLPFKWYEINGSRCIRTMQHSATIAKHWKKFSKRFTFCLKNML